jgi:hypothetical protein
VVKTPVRTTLLPTVVVLSLCFGVGRAESQSTSPPSTAVYGGAQARNVSSDGLGLSVQAYEAYDDNVLTGTTGSGGPRPSIFADQSGFYSGLAVGLLYGHSGEAANFRSWANSALAYYPDQSDLSAIYHQVGLGFGTPLGDRVSVNGNAYGDYSPYYSLRLVPVLTGVEPQPAALETANAFPAPAPELDYTVIQRDAYRYGGNAGMSISVTDRSSIGLAYGYGQTSSSDGLFDMRVRTAGANFGYKITRNASLRAGYYRYEGIYERPNARHTVAESINVGVDYSKPLSITRKTSLQFGTGTAVAENLSGERTFRATGAAALAHQIGRSWSARADYRRGVGYLEGINEPTFYDSAGASVGGLVSSRVELSTAAQYFRGSSSLRSTEPPFDTYSAWVRMRTALNRSLAVYAEYFFYHYDFDQPAVQIVGVPSRYSRQGARVGLSLWVPLVSRN